MSYTLQYLHRSSASLGVIFPSSHLEVNFWKRKKMDADPVNIAAYFVHQLCFHCV